MYREVESFYRRALEPGFGTIADPSDLQPSPDGRWIAFRGARRDALEGHPEGRICLVGVDGSELRQLTNGPHDDDQPRWSPDGGTLTFRSDRAAPGRHQLYRLSTDEIGEAQALPTVEGVAEHHAWAPDGTRILVVVAGLDAEQSDAVGSGTIAASDDMPAWIPEVESTDRADDMRRRLCTIDVATGAVAPVGRSELNVWEASWCGNDRIAAIVSDDPGEGAWYGARLVMIDLASGLDRTILESDIQLGWVSGSPDGTRLAVVEALCSDRLVVAGELLLVDPVDGGVVRVDTTHVDVAGLAWRDQERLLAIGVRDLDSVVLDVDAKTDTATVRWETEEACGALFIAAAPVGDGFGLVLQSATRPPEMVLVGDDGTERTVVHTTHEGTDLIRSSIGSRTRLSWEAPDGLPISGLLTVPAGDPPFPLILTVHGGPVWAYQDFWPGPFGALLATRGYATLMANPRGSWGRGRDFAARVVGDMGGRGRPGSARRRRPCRLFGDRRSRPPGDHRRELWRVHVRVAPVHRSALPRRGGALARHRLVLGAVRQQPRDVDGRLPGRGSRHPRGALPRAEPRLRRRLEPDPDAPHGGVARQGHTYRTGDRVPSRPPRARRSDGRDPLSAGGPRCPRPAGRDRPRDPLGGLVRAVHAAWRGRSIVFRA